MILHIIQGNKSFQVCHIQKILDIDICLHTSVLIRSQVLLQSVLVFLGYVKIRAGPTPAQTCLVKHLKQFDHWQKCNKE